jgi:hypothetical protein
MPFFVTGCNYNPMCYYENVAAHISSTSILPYMLLTSNYVINISYDVSYATISSSPLYIELYLHIFEDFVKKSTPMLTILPKSQVSQFLASAFQYGSLHSYFSYYPHLTSIMTERIFNQYLLPNFSKHRNAIIPAQRKPSADEIKTVYFAENGLDDFLNTGKLPESFLDFSPSTDTADRYSLLKEFYNMALAGIYHPVLINSAVFPISKCLSVLNFQNAIAFLLMFSNNESNICIIQEKSLVFAFQDFFKYLPESNLVLSEEKALAVIKSRLDNM